MIVRRIPGVCQNGDAHLVMFYHRINVFIRDKAVSVIPEVTSKRFISMAWFVTLTVAVKWNKAGVAVASFVKSFSNVIMNYEEAGNSHVGHYIPCALLYVLLLLCADLFILALVSRRRWFMHFTKNREVQDWTASENLFGDGYQSRQRKKKLENRNLGYSACWWC